MLSGIYELTFKTGDTYVGQAKNFDKRWEQHYNDLRKNKHTKAMQRAYEGSCGALPDAKVLTACHPDYLDHYESYWIHELQPSLNHQIPQPLDEYTRKWLVALANSGEAHNSIAQLIDEVHSGNEAKLEVGRLRDTLDDRVKVAALAIEGHEECLEQLEKLRWVQQKLLREVAALEAWRERVKGLGWWKRLWKAWD